MKKNLISLVVVDPSKNLPLVQIAAKKLPLSCKAFHMQVVVRIFKRDLTQMRHQQIRFLFGVSDTNFL